MADARLYREIQIQGLAGFTGELADARRLLPMELHRADLEAARLVAAGARRRVPRGPHQGGGDVTPVAASIQAGVGARGGYVAIGGAASPHAQPLEFGGTLARFHSTSRTQVPKRSYVYATLAAERTNIDDLYLDALERAVRGAFPGRALARAS